MQARANSSPRGAAYPLIAVFGFAGPPLHVSPTDRRKLALACDVAVAWLLKEQLDLVAKIWAFIDTASVSQKHKLIAKLQTKSGNFSWDDTVALMRVCNFTLRNNTRGSGRMFVHQRTARKFGSMNLILATPCFPT